MHALPTRWTAALAAALLVVSFRSLAGAATLESITVSPAVVHLRPCETTTLVITGHYDDGTERDLSTEASLTFAFATGNAAQNGPGSVVMTGLLDDELTIGSSGVESAPVPILIVNPQDLSLCVIIGTTTTTTTSSPPTTTSSSTTTLPPSTTTTTTTVTTLAPSSTTTSTLPPLPEADDAACGFCVHDRVQHRFRIQNHPIFHREQLLQDRCAATEFPLPVLRVAADGTQSSVFDVQRVVEGSCQTTLTDPTPLFLDDQFQPIQNPDPDFYGTAVAIDRRPDYVRFNYTHPTTLPDEGDKYRVVTIGIFYTDTRNPGGPQRLGTVMHLQVYRPPVVMIHGLWSDASAFAGMEQELTASQYEAFQLYRLDYRGTNDSSFMVNYARVADGIDAVIQQGADADLAAGKVDLVTHSMGGVLSRLYIQNPGYEHEVHRIVTCNTPHAGSQMANLLLDRSFDPQGLICRLLSQGMSSATVPNRGCYNGAVDDMRVSSFATTNFLNLGTHPTEVGVHAVATVYDPSLLLNVVPAVASGAGTVPFLIAHLARACGLSLFDSIFNSDDSDLIVSATSQAGGLGGSLTSLYSPQWHMEAAANPDVIGRVKELLNEPANSTSFTSSGYSPGQLPYTTPTSVCPLLRRARTLGSTRGIADTGLTITSPVSGTTLASGESFTVEAAGGTDIATIVLVMSQPEGQMLLVEQPGPAASFEVQVPDTAIGQQNLVVAGLDASGSLVAVSDTVTVG